MPSIPDNVLIEGEVVAEIRPFAAWRKPVREEASVVAPETVRLASVPTEVREDVTTFEARVVPVSVPAGAAFNVAKAP